MSAAVDMHISVPRDTVLDLHLDADKELFGVLVCQVLLNKVLGAQSNLIRRQLLDFLSGRS